MCWADREAHSNEAYIVVSTVPSGNSWTAVSVGDTVACALSLEGEITCFGMEIYGLDAVPEPT